MASAKALGVSMTTWLLLTATVVLIVALVPMWAPVFAAEVELVLVRSHGNHRSIELYMHTTTTARDNTSLQVVLAKDEARNFESNLPEWRKYVSLRPPCAS